MKIESYRNLNVWQKAIELTKSVYLFSTNLPKEELYGLTQQMRRSAVSIPSNIAEGHNRDSLKDYLRFISIARGSAAELETQLLIAYELNFVSDVRYKDVATQIGEVSRMLRGLQQSLKAKLLQNSAPLPLEPRT